MSASTLPVTAPARPAPSTHSQRRRWPPAIWALPTGTFVVRAAGFSYPFLSYRMAKLNFTTTAVGYVLAAFGVGWLASQLLCGWLADRVGRRATLLGAMLVAAIALPALAMAQSAVPVFAAVIVVGMVFDAPRPIVSAVIIDSFPTESGRTRVNAARHFAVNIGAGLTGAVGGLLAGDVGTRTLFLINAAACASFGLLALAVMKPSVHSENDAHDQPRFRAALADGRLRLLWLASLAALTCCASMFSALPMLMAADGLDAAAYGWTQVAAAMVVVALSPVITPWLSHRAARDAPMLGLFAFSSLLLGIGMGACGLASTTPGYSLAACIAVPGEIILFIAASDILNRISPANARGLYAGIWGGTLAVAVIIAPLLAAWALNTGGDDLAAFTILASGTLGAALCAPLARLIGPARTATASRSASEPQTTAVQARPPSPANDAA
ncbi:MFS transporter [Streptomyces sp. NPDC005408]|uniref:MFS transporter n=1 Tax=Streptomyces sp. NPDC005408 TaxID=3155341 RepID=UPI0033B1F6E6